MLQQVKRILCVRVQQRGIDALLDLKPFDIERTIRIQPGIHAQRPLLNFKFPFVAHNPGMRG